ncbi:Acylamino-acid-releasing enzyme [Tetrabaena socialis]|uniref:acylaminoacyl-peptidase n=1 Tax=Tetrabaena socialis TaxID=47790 RepID=A0A2J8A796_9CHLO|nr:Acylamino-acid-releasing enzyme [Tetrabaena socialis]|eukprot:PNH08402.1 Acylamino-acid-releasing enzyme [Tetrabaena socialis]
MSPSLTTAAAATAPAPTSEPAPAKPAASGGPAESPAGMEAEAALLAAFAEVPVVSRAVVRPAAGGGLTLTVTLQQRNLPGNSQRRYNVTAALPAGAPDGGSVAALVGLPQELHADVQLVSVSPSGTQQLVVLKGNDTSGAVLQVWRGARLVAELVVPKTLHGALVNDGYFASGAAWAADESAVVYTAEAPAPERTPAWCGPESLKDAAGPKSWRGVGAAVEDWGELNTGKRPPAPFVLDLTRREVLKIPGLSEEHSVGQPTWCPPTTATAATAATATTASTGGGPSGLLLVAWPHAPPPSFPRLAAAAAPRKLGVVFCYNRCAHLYHLPMTRGADGRIPDADPAAAAAATAAATAARTKAPCISDFLPQAKSLPASALQFGASAVRLCPSLESALSPIFSPAGDALLLVSHSEAVATGTHGATGRLYRLAWSPERGSDGSSESCAVRLDWRPLELGSPGGGGGGGLRGELPAAVQEALDRLEYRVVRVTPRVGDCSAPFDNLIWLPKDRTGPLPAVIAPHGGPHTAVQLAWYPPYAYLTALGYAVLCPNYRGSTGYGQAALASLPGAIGRNDVDDCLAAVDAAVAEEEDMEDCLVDGGRVSVIGGSHGGFLTGHLLGQHPGRFRCGVMRNPVTNISAMVAASDITDWCYVETMGSEEGRRRCAPVPSPADLAAMFAASPAAHVDAVTAPVFMMLGAKDRRVPPQDGLQYLAALRGRDVVAAGPPPATRLIVFPEDMHGLDKPQTEYEQWLNAAWWLKAHAGPRNGQPGEDATGAA